MIKYYMSYEKGTMYIKDYDTNNGVRYFHNSVVIYNNTLIVNALYDTIRECLSSCRNYQKPILYRGQNINVWQPDIFISVNKYTGEMWQDYHFDDSKLKEIERELTA